MACTCSHEPVAPKPDSKFRTALWIALFINLAMFLVELIGGAYAHSSALWASSLDFFGDAVNYAISLAVLGASLYWRATVALAKGLVMAGFGLVVIGKVIYAYAHGIAPEAVTMGAIGVPGFNRQRCGGLYSLCVPRRAIPICSRFGSAKRNDAIGNVAVILAAVGVFGTGDIADIIVAVIMAGLGLSGGYRVIKKSIEERKSTQLSAAS